MRFSQVARAQATKFFSLDYRSLALLRIGIGVVLMLDLLQRAGDLFAHYSDGGVLPRAEYLSIWNNEWLVSLHMASGSWQFEALLFIFAFIFALFLTLGYRTKLAMVLSWFLLVSLHIRNPLVLQGGDVLLRAVLFWMMFLPLNKKYSLDRLFNRISSVSAKEIFSPATLAYTVQIAIFYIFTAVLKNGAPWHLEASAVYLALNMDQFVTWFGIWIRQYNGLMAFLTHAVLYTELIAPLLFFVPFKTGYFRMAGLIALACLQIGLNASMRLGYFGLIAIVVTIGLIPTVIWDNHFRVFAQRLARKAKKGLSIYYDVDCSFCQKATVRLKEFFLLHPDTVVKSSSEDSVVMQSMQEHDSWVVIDAGGQKYFAYDGFVCILKHSPYLAWLAPILAFKPIAWVGNRLYRHVAKNRLRVCVPETHARPETARQEFFRKTKGRIVLVLLLYVVIWNIGTLEKRPIDIPDAYRWIGQVSGLEQKFGMFAPNPPSDDGWYVFPGELRDGTKVDVYTGAHEISYAKPESVAYTYKNQRWQKYLMNLWLADYASYRLSYGRYLCRNWNADAPFEKQLMSYDIVFMLENTPPQGEPVPPAVPQIIWEHKCF